MDALFVDDKLPILINQVRYVLLPKPDNTLQSIYGNEPALGILVRRVMECVINILDSINRVGSLFNDTIQKLRNLLTGFLDILSKFFPTFRTVTIFLVQVRQRIDKILSFLPQTICGLLQSVVSALTIGHQLIQVLHVCDPKFIGIGVILYLEPQISQRLNAGRDRAFPLVIQILQRLLLTLIGTDQLTLQKDFLSQIVRVINFGFKLRSGLLCLAQPFNRLSIVVNGSDILFDIFLRAATRLRIALETLQRRIFQRLQSRDLSINLADRVLVLGNIQFNLGNKVLQIAFLSGVRIFCPLKATACQVELNATTASTTTRPTLYVSRSSYCTACNTSNSLSCLVCLLCDRSKIRLYAGQVVVHRLRQIIGSLIKVAIYIRADLSRYPVELFRILSHSSRRQLKRSRLINASINQSLSNSVTGIDPILRQLF